MTAPCLALMLEGASSTFSSDSQARCKAGGLASGSEPIECEKDSGFLGLKVSTLNTAVIEWGQKYAKDGTFYEDDPKRKACAPVNMCSDRNSRGVFKKGGGGYTGLDEHGKTTTNAQMHWPKGENVIEDCSSPWSDTGRGDGLAPPSTTQNIVAIGHAVADWFTGLF